MTHATVEDLKHDALDSNDLRAWESLAARLQQRVLALEQLNMVARAFHDRYALGTLAAPSCIVCGHLTPHPAAVQHAELPGIVVCSCCKQASESFYREANGLESACPSPGNGP